MQDCIKLKHNGSNASQENAANFIDKASNLIRKYDIEANFFKPKTDLNTKTCFKCDSIIRLKAQYCDQCGYYLNFAPGITANKEKSKVINAEDTLLVKNMAIKHCKKLIKLECDEKEALIDFRATDTEDLYAKIEKLLIEGRSVMNFYKLRGNLTKYNIANRMYNRLIVLRSLRYSLHNAKRDISLYYNSLSDFNKKIYANAISEYKVGQLYIEPES